MVTYGVPVIGTATLRLHRNFEIRWTAISQAEISRFLNLKFLDFSIRNFSISQSEISGFLNQKFIDFSIRNFSISQSEISRFLKQKFLDSNSYFIDSFCQISLHINFCWIYIFIITGEFDRQRFYHDMTCVAWHTEKRIHFSCQIKRNVIVFNLFLFFMNYWN